jgi:hypothetical protein
LIGAVAANVTPPTAMLRLVELADWLFESDTLTVNIEFVPIADFAGVPEISPVPGVKFSPAGRLPEITDQV